MVKVLRRTETGEAPAWQGEKSENTGSIRPMSDAARRDAAPVECSGTFTTGCSSPAPRKLLEQPVVKVPREGKGTFATDC